MISAELQIIAVFLSSLFAALFVLPKLAHIAERIGLLDQPSKRKVHMRPRPLVGGVGMVIAATFTSLAFVPITGLRGYFLGLSVLLFVGFLDDFKEVGHKQKFVAQILAAVLLVYFSDVCLQCFGNLLRFGQIWIPGGDIVEMVVTIFCIVGVINSVNLIDGLDGLAGGISFNAFMFFAVHASLNGNVSLMMLNFALAGAVLGFLRYNWYPSVMFMGDAGSLCLGFSLGYMALALTQGEGAGMAPVSALLILAVPITDTLVIMSKRALKGSSPFLPDKKHLHHIFMRYGMGRLGTVKVILGMSFVLGALSLLSPLYKVPDYVLFAVFGVYFLVYTIASFYIPVLLRYSHRFRSKKPKNGEAHILLRLFLGGFDAFRLIRKSKRYNVYLKFQCTGDDGRVFDGKVLDLSQHGCMAMVKELEHLDVKMRLIMYFPFADEVRQVELDAEHIWAFEKAGVYYHGFKFDAFNQEQMVSVAEYLATIDEKAQARLVYELPPS